MMEKKVVDIKNMTLEEKASLCVGEDYWNSKKIKKYNIVVK